MTLDRIGSRGVRYALLAALLFGAGTPAAKMFLSVAPPQLVAGLLYLGSGGGLLLHWLARRRVNPGEAPLGRAALPWLAGATLSGGVVGPLLLMAGLARTPASAASLLLNLEAVFTAAVAWLVVREHVHGRIVIGMLAIVAGGVLLSWHGRLAWNGFAGPLLVACACLAWGVDNNLTRRISSGDPLQITWMKGLVAGVTNGGLAMMLGGRLPGLTALLGTFAVGFLSYGVSLVLYVRALRELGTARTAAYFSLAPFIGAGLAVLVWHERVSPALLVAALLMGFGLWLHLTERHAHVHTHEPLEHSHAHRHDEHHRHAHTPDDPPGEPHAHQHRHEALTHGHPHYPDIHHRHSHG